MSTTQTFTIGPLHTMSRSDVSDRVVEALRWIGEQGTEKQWGQIINIALCQITLADGPHLLAMVTLAGHGL